MYNNNNNQNVDRLLQAMSEYEVTFKEVLQAIETVALDRQFHKDLDMIHYTEVLDDWDNWQ